MCFLVLRSGASDQQISRQGAWKEVDNASKNYGPKDIMCSDPDNVREHSVHHFLLELGNMILSQKKFAFFF